MGVITMPSSQREPSDAVCWNCDRRAHDVVPATVGSPVGGHIVLTLCRACYASSYLPLAGGGQELMPGDGPSKLVLVVDDEPDIVWMLRHTFEGKGYAVDGAANGLEALYKACRYLPQVVVLDLAMPTLDGHKFIAAWREAAADVPIPSVAISAHHDRATAEELGVAAFVPKPFDLDALVETVGSLLKAAP